MRRRHDSLRVLYAGFFPASIQHDDGQAGGHGFADGVAQPDDPFPEQIREEQDEKRRKNQAAPQGHQQRLLGAQTVDKTKSTVFFS